MTYEITSDTSVLCCKADSETFWIGFHSGGRWWHQDVDEWLLQPSHWIDLPEAPQ